MRKRLGFDILKKSKKKSENGKSVETKKESKEKKPWSRQFKQYVAYGVAVTILGIVSVIYWVALNDGDYTGWLFTLALGVSIAAGVRIGFAGLSLLFGNRAIFIKYADVKIEKGAVTNTCAGDDRRAIRNYVQQESETNRNLLARKNGTILFFPLRTRTNVGLFFNDIGSLIMTPYWYTVITIMSVIISYTMARSFYEDKNSYFLELDEEKSSKGANTLKAPLDAVKALLSVLLPLFFMKQLEKYRESRKLFQSICGDIKAMAIYILNLTTNEKKYILKRTEGERLKFDRENVKTPLRGDVEYIFSATRYILAALPQTVKHTIREKLDPVYQFDPKMVTFGHQMRIIKGNVCGLGPTYSNKDKDGKLLGTWYNDTNPLGKTLYYEMLDVRNRSQMDYFETMMYMLLRYINRLKEVKIINEGLERDIIGKWHHIYAAWGPLVTKQTDANPALINLVFYLGLWFYAVFLPLTHANIEGWGLMMSLVQVALYAILLMTGRAIQSPFKKVWFAPSISNDAIQTQEHIVRLMKQHVVLDQNFLYGYNIDLSREKIEKSIIEGKGNIQSFEECLTYVEEEYKENNERKKREKKNRRQSLFQSKDSQPLINDDEEKKTSTKQIEIKIPIKSNFYF